MSTVTFEKITVLSEQLQDLDAGLRQQGVRIMSLWLRANFFGQELPATSEAALELALESRDMLAEQWRHAVGMADSLGYSEALEWLSGPAGALFYEQTADHRAKCRNLPVDDCDVPSLERYRDRPCRRARRPHPFGDLSA